MGSDFGVGGIARSAYRVYVYSSVASVVVSPNACATWAAVYGGSSGCFSLAEEVGLLMGIQLLHVTVERGVGSFRAISRSVNVFSKEVCLIGRNNVLDRPVAPPVILVVTGFF